MFSNLAAWDWLPDWNWDLISFIVFMVLGIGVILAVTIYLLVKLCHKASFCKARGGRVLQRFARRRKYRCWKDITVALPDGNWNLDWLILGDFGLLGATVRGEMGSFYGDDRDESWAIVRDARRASYPNPALAGRKYAESLRILLAKERIYGVQMEHLTVIAGPRKKTETFIQTGEKVLRPGRLRQYLYSARFDRDPGYPLEKIAGLLEGLIRPRQ